MIFAHVTFTLFDTCYGMLFFTPISYIGLKPGVFVFAPKRELAAVIFAHVSFTPISCIGFKPGVRSLSLVSSPPLKLPHYPLELHALDAAEKQHMFVFLL